MTEQEINNLIDSKIGKTKMSQLPEATQTSGLYSIGYTGNQSVKYKADLLQGDPLTVRKTYQTEALALADKNPVDPTTSLPLTVGQFVSIVDDGEKNGIYRISSIGGDGTMSLELQGKLGDLSYKADHGYDSSPKTLKEVESQLVRDYLYLGNKPKSIRAMQSGVVDAILDAYLDIEMRAGKYYVFSLFNKPELEIHHFALYERDIATDEYSQLLLFNESNSVQVVGNIRLYTIGNSKVLVNWDAISVTSISLNQADGVELSPKIFKNGRLNDYNKLIKEEIISANRHNPTTDLIGKAMSSTAGSNIYDSPNYNLSDYIEVESGIPYKSSYKLRRYWVYPEIGPRASLMDENLPANTPFTPVGKYVRFMYSNIYTSPVDVKFGKASEDISGSYSSKVYFNDTELLTQHSNFINEIKIHYKPSANRHNPTTDLIGKSMSTSGVNITDSLNYNLSDYIEVESGIPYISSYKLRRYWVYPELNSGASLEVENLPANTPFTPVGKYVRFIYDNRLISPVDVKFGKASEDISGEYGEYPFDKHGRPLLGNSNPVSETGNIVTIENMDKILFVGSSSTESHYTLRNKSWFMKLNDELDWLFVTYAFSGYSAEDLADRLSSGYPSPTASGLHPNKINPSYVHVGQYGNMSTSGMSSLYSDEFVEANRKLALVAQSVFGAKLILGSGYKAYENHMRETGIKTLADEFGADYMPWGATLDNILNAYKPAQLWGNGHPTTRTNNQYFQEAYNSFKKWQSPKQSLKLFVPRETLSDYSYRNNKERSLKFRSIQVGEQSLTDDLVYDRMYEPHAYQSFTRHQSEYNMLIQKQEVAFGSALCAEFILPVIHTDILNIVVKGVENLTFKLYNNLTSSFESVDTDYEGIMYKLDANKAEYISHDKVKLLIEGVDVKITDIYATYSGGREKQRIDKQSVIPYGGKHILGGVGFEDGWDSEWVVDDGVTSFVQSVKYQTADMNDKPSYLPESSKVVVLPYSETERITISKPVNKETLYGDRSSASPIKVKVEVYARAWTPMYDPDRFAEWTGDNNPYTDNSIINTDSYDYVTLAVGIKGKKEQIDTEEQRVGLFWARHEFELYLHPFSGNINIVLFRKMDDINPSFELEIADVIVSVV